jgi:hypothetical protein
MMTTDKPFLVLLAALPLLALAGCAQVAEFDFKDAGAGGTAGGGGKGGADAGDAGDAGEPCPGQCVPLGPLGWSMPALLWTGKESEAPACPSRAPVQGYEGHADLNAPSVCGACQCDSPSGSCALPTTLTAAAATCAGDGPNVKHTPFNAPAGWTGACTTLDAIQAGVPCPGGFCVQSLTIAPLTLMESGCKASMGPVPTDGPATWGTYARACLGAAYPACSNPGEVCTPSSEPPPPGFKQCIYREGDRDCPFPYPDKHLFYDAFDDMRMCTPCTCGAPAGSTCTATVAAYKDNACTMQITANLVGSAQPLCVDVLPGSGLGSKSAGAVTYTPGTCQPDGGQPMGSADPSGPSTFCCLP